jgi:branched-chain amino acid transport system permease protein
VTVAHLEQTLVNGLTLGSLYALYALGIALIFGVMRLINFAYGELIMVAAYTLFVFSDWPPVLLVLTTLAVVVVASLAMERVAFRPARGSEASTLLVLSFAVSTLLQNGAIVIFGSEPKAVNVFSGLDKQVTHGATSINLLNIVTVVVTILLLAGLAFFLARTRLGIQMRAAAEDFTMARLLGVRANTIIATAFVFSGIVAATAGILQVAQNGAVAPTIGSSAVLVAFVATVIGGLGSLGGAVLGGYLFAIVTVALQTYLPEEFRPYRDAFAFLLVIIFLIVRPQGLIASRSRMSRV